MVPNFKVSHHTSNDKIQNVLLWKVTIFYINLFFVYNAKAPSVLTLQGPTYFTENQQKVSQNYAELNRLELSSLEAEIWRKYSGNRVGHFFCIRP